MAPDLEIFIVPCLQRKPDADLDVEDQIGGGEQIVFAPEPTWTGVEESRDPEEWAAVERVLPQGTVPEPPKHDSYPTPSGWFPATGEFLLCVNPTWGIADLFSLFTFQPNLETTVTL